MLTVPSAKWTPPPLHKALSLPCLLVTVLLIITVFTYYTSVAKGSPFKSRFLEMAIISITVALLSFFVGIGAKQLFGVDI